MRCDMKIKQYPNNEYVQSMSRRVVTTKEAIIEEYSYKGRLM